MQEWEWCIVVDEQTDEMGWQYGCCSFRKMSEQRAAGRRCGHGSRSDVRRLAGVAWDGDGLVGSSEPT